MSTFFVQAKERKIIVQRNPQRLKLLLDLTHKKRYLVTFENLYGFWTEPKSKACFLSLYRASTTDKDISN
ncbi:MAG: hypothetical protein CMP11_00895 [Zetaproteobacteria bacterium]|nr:hypothetical protein [Pseudobdellovibrionaceae bacterium]